MSPKVEVCSISGEGISAISAALTDKPTSLTFLLHLTEFSPSKGCKLHSNVCVGCTIPIQICRRKLFRNRIYFFVFLLSVIEEGQGWRVRKKEQSHRQTSNLEYLPLEHIKWRHVKMHPSNANLDVVVSQNTYSSAATISFAKIVCQQTAYKNERELSERMDGVKKRSRVGKTRLVFRKRFHIAGG